MLGILEDMTRHGDIAVREDAFNQRALAGYYERSMFDPLIAEFTDGSDYHNFGYWTAETRNLTEACELLMEKLLEHIPRKEGRILDVACGKGATTRHLTEYYPRDHVTAVDVSARLLERARQNAPGCRFLQMDATCLEFASSSFNAVICVEAAFHFYPRRRFLDEAHRVLKAGGTLVLSDTLVSRQAGRTRIGRTSDNHIASLPDYRDGLIAAGFKEVEIIDVTGPCWRGLYWGLVRFAHEKLLRKEIEVADMERLLAPTYGRVGSLEKYFIATGRK